MEKIGCFAKKMQKQAIASALCIVANFCAAASPCSDEALGLVLSGGGAKGAYEVGVWQELVEQGLYKRVAAISGTSVGAINASMFAAVVETNKCASLWYEEVGSIFQFNTNLVVKVLGEEGSQKVHRAYETMRRNIHNDCKSEAARRRCDVSNLPPEIIAEIKERCGSVFRKRLFFELPMLKTLENMFSDFDESKPIEGFLSPSVLHSCIMRELSAAWRDDAPSVYATALKKSTNYTFAATSFSIRGEKPERRASMICASACIPFIFGSCEIDDGIYVDGGLEAKGGDNTPIGPILENHPEVKTVVVVYLRDAKHLDAARRSRVSKAAEQKGVRLVEIIPSENIDGMLGLGVFDTSPNTIKRLVEMGRKDAKEALKKAKLEE